MDTSKSSYDETFSFTPRDETEGERLQKVLARLGYGSRRVCEELIESGRVRIDGRRAILGSRVRPGVERVTVDDVEVATAPDMVYYLLNKPAGVITTAADPQGRPKVTDFVPVEPRVFPVGRLDLESEGLLLLTNDGALAQLLTHPSHGVEKEYLTYVDGALRPHELAQLRRGVELSDGRTQPAKVSLLAPDLVKITIHEGRNRQIRRMCEAVGHRVLRLVRTRIGPITDRTLAQGSVRELSTSEVIALRGTPGARR
ncbi:MAG: pseudouridine synthase [Acidimicrobiales bacterium]